jgi:hypothetical protein
MFNILDSILKFSGKIFSSLALRLVELDTVRIRIGRLWMQIWIRQNDADPTGSGSTAQVDISFQYWNNGSHRRNSMSSLSQAKFMAQRFFKKIERRLLIPR